MRSFKFFTVRGPKQLELHATSNPLARWEKPSRRFAIISAWFVALGLGVLTAVTLYQRRAVAEDILQAQESRCLELTLLWESEHKERPYPARGVSVVDKIAVTQNILERTVSPEYPATICGVVNEVRKHRTTKVDTAMYSYIKDGRADPGLFGGPEWELSQRVAREVLADWKANGRDYQYYPEVRKLASYSTHYHAEMKKWPEWAYSDVKSCRLKPLGKIGAHYHYADFRRADPKGYAQCIAKRDAALKVAQR